MFDSFHHKRITSGLLICAMILAIYWCLSYLATYPVELRTARGDAQLWFRADRNRVWFNNDCIQLSWEVSGIATIFVYDEPTIGSSTYSACSFTEHSPTFEITFPDGQREFFFLDVAQMYLRFDHWLVLLLISVCLWMAWTTAHKPQPIEVGLLIKAAGQALGVGLLTILLWQRANTTFAFLDIVVPNGTLRERVADTRGVRSGLQIATLTPADAVILVPLGVTSAPALHAVAYSRTFLYTGQTTTYYETYYGDGSLVPFRAAQANVERLKLDAVVSFDNLYLLLNNAMYTDFSSAHGEAWIAEAVPLPEDNLTLIRIRADAPVQDLHLLIAQVQADSLITIDDEE